MTPDEYAKAEQAGLDADLERLLNPPDRYALILEFPVGTDRETLDQRIKSVLTYADDIIHNLGGNVVGYYEEDYA